MSGTVLGRALSRTVLWVYVAALVAPLVGTLLFALATRWVVTILPEGLTLAAVLTTVQHPRFAETLGRSIGLGAAAALLDAVLVVPAATALMLARPRWQVLLDLATVVPFALPGVVVALGLLRFYAWAWPDARHTPQLLVAATPPAAFRSCTGQ